MRTALAVMAVLLVLTLIGWIVVFPYITADSVTFTVTGKERINGSSGSSKYLVFTDDEVFENVDSIRRWKFDSSDLYGHIQIGETYTADVYGWRIRFLSMYRNIVRVDSEPAAEARE